MKDKELFEQLKRGKDEAFAFLYSEYFNMVRHLILNNSGDEQQASDIFQEVVIVFFERLRDNRLELKASVKTLCYSIARNLWLKELRRKKGKLNLKDFENYLVIDEDDSQDELIESNRLQLIADCLEKLGDPCRKLLQQFYYLRQSMNEIADELGYQSADSVKTQKYKCLQKLKTLALS